MERVALIGENSIHYVRKLLEAWQKNECVILFDRNIPRNPHSISFSVVVLYGDLPIPSYSI